MVTYFDVADYFIWLANTTGSYISNLKLQKLVYYSQAWHLALEDEPLFEEDFEAWIHGPVIPALYRSYKKFGATPIIKDYITLNLPDLVVSHLKSIADEYFGIDAYDLERMTHREQPWIIARGEIPNTQPSNSIIKKQWMQEYYKEYAEEEES